MYELCKQFGKQPASSVKYVRIHTVNRACIDPSNVKSNPLMGLANIRCVEQTVKQTKQRYPLIPLMNVEMSSTWTTSRLRFGGPCAA